MTQSLNNQPSILIVDDDDSVIASLSLLLKQHKFAVFKANNPEQALQIISNNTVNLMLQDMNFSRATSGEEGLTLLKDARHLSANLPVILMTAWGSIGLAVEGMRAGASDFITKPWQNEQLIRTISTTIGLSHYVNEPPLTRQQLNEQGDFSKIIGESPALLQVLQVIARVSKTDASVLILGESGTGKEMIADAIHRNSPRKDEALVKVNLGGIPNNLFESEMFGHVKGAYTDAKHDRQGRFSLADNGSLFLDEIGELDKSSQVKLLRVLQDQNFQLVGSSKNCSVNVRIIAATNCDLATMVANDTFREDLYYRINLITIELPPLRQRVSDIPLLAKHHLKKVAKLYGLPPCSISNNALLWLQQQPWPGNIRQLQQSIERTLLMSGKHALDVVDFCPTAPAENDDFLSNAAIGLDKVTIEQMEKLMIERALITNEGNISKVADALGLSRAALYRRLEKYEITDFKN